MVDVRHLCLHINSFYVLSVFYAVFVCVSFAFYAVFAYVSFVFYVFAFDNRQRSENDSYRLQVVLDVYQRNEFHYLPMSPSLLWRKIVISVPIKKLKQSNVNV